MSLVVEIIFEEVMLIRNDNDLKEFKEIYSIDTDIEKFY